MFGTGHHQVIYQGGAQTLRTVPLNKQARPTGATTATYRIVDLRLGEDDPLRLIASGNATIDMVITTTSAAVGLGTSKAKELPVASAVGFTAGKHYLITDASGIRELVLCEGVTTGLIKLRNELARKFDSGVIVAGIEVSCTFPSLEAANENSLQDQGGPYAVDWSWDVDPSPKREMVFIVRQADGLAVTEEELLGLDPTLASTGGNRIPLTTCIRQASMEIRAQMQAHQVDPNGFDGGTTARLAVMYRAAWHAVRLTASAPSGANEARATTYKEESQKYVDNLLIGRSPEKSVKVNPSTDSTSAGSDKSYKHWQVLS